MFLDQLKAKAGWELASQLAYVDITGSIAGALQQGSWDDMSFLADSQFIKSCLSLSRGF